MLDLLLTLISPISTIAPILGKFFHSGKSGDHLNAFPPIKMVYHFENKSVSLACFLLATSFSSGRGNAGILTNLYRTTNSTFVPILGKSGDHHNAIYPN